MLALIMLVAAGLGMAYFATENVVSVPITMAGSPVGQFPLYVIVLGSVLAGLLLAWVISLVNGLSSSMKILGKDSEIKRTQKTLEQMQRENHDLELEVARLKGQVPKEPIRDVEEAQDEEVRPSVWDRVRGGYQRT